MRWRVHLAVAVAALLSFSGLSHADDLTSLSDLDLLTRTREAVEAQDANGALSLLTEMQRRGTGIFAGAETAVCEEVIDLPDGITDWRFKGAARQAYITAAKAKSLEGESCGCLFADLSFADFTAATLGKAPSELVDGDRASLEAFLAENQRETEAAYRDHEKSCQAN